MTNIELGFLIVVLLTVFPVIVWTLPVVYLRRKRYRHEIIEIGDHQFKFYGNEVGFKRWDPNNSETRRRLERLVASGAFNELDRFQRLQLAGSNGERINPTGPWDALLRKLGFRSEYAYLQFTYLGRLDPRWIAL